MEIKTAERNWGLDFLRVWAAFTVVLLHVNPQAYLEVEIASASWNVMNLVTTLCSWNVPAFFMISGAFLLTPPTAPGPKKLARKHLSRLAAAFVFWAAVYALAYCVLRGKGKWTFLNELIRGHYHMWYLFALISLYLIVPLLQKMTASRKTTEYFLLLFFVLSFCIGRALNFVLLLDLPHQDVIQSLQSAYAQINPYRVLTPLYYFVLGHYLFAYPPAPRMRRLFYASGMAGCVLTALLTRWHSGVLQATSSVFSANASLGVLAMTSALFVFFQSLHFNLGTKAKTVLLGLSKCTFGVYLIHPLVLERLNTAYPLQAGPLLASILGIAVLVFFVSLAVSAVMRRIPILKKVI